MELVARLDSPRFYAAERKRIWDLSQQFAPKLRARGGEELANEFNLMARSLRDYRDSHSAQLLRAQRTSQATINSFPDPVLVVDTEGHVEMANPSAQRLTGYSASVTLLSP